jgi:pimeloyl-ACP methyl ester carboxylesterase
MPGPGEYSIRTAMAHRLEEELSAVDRLLAPGRRFLLVDWEGDGRMVEWLGPADAEHVALLVPGMGAEKLRMDGLARLAGRMIRHDPTVGDLAVVTTLAYDAPDWLGSAALGSAADDGATALSELIAGLPEDRHLTLVGHSSGSVVVARAHLQRCGERVGDVVVLGSPGLGVDHVSELPIPADRLWVGRTPGDEIGAALDARGLAQVVRCLPPVGGGPFPVSRCDPPTSLVHGTDPAGDGFGAQQFDAGVPDGVGGLAHNRYWAVTVDAEGREMPSEALRNLLLIATGQRARVRRRRRSENSSHP